MPGIEQLELRSDSPAATEYVATRKTGDARAKRRAVTDLSGGGGGVDTVRRAAAEVAQATAAAAQAAADKASQAGRRNRSALFFLQAHSLR